MSGQIKDRVKLFANVDRQKLHGAKITLYTICSFRMYRMQHKVNTRKPLTEPEKLASYKLFSILCTMLATLTRNMNPQMKRERKNSMAYTGGISSSAKAAGITLNTICMPAKGWNPL